MNIETRRGDITRQPDVDAIVNAANTELWLGSGVAGAIAARGGPGIEEEALAQAPIKLGDAVATTAGNLPNRFVIHAAAMGYRPEDQDEPRRRGSLSSAATIRKATLSSLQLADRLRCTSIAFPALATGVAGFPVDECAETMISAARDFDRGQAHGIGLVVFVLWSAGDLETFDRILHQAEA
jgi:O-acetyl-ADP-ribose deacetylase (regulator of RNase III)